MLAAQRLPRAAPFTAARAPPPRRALLVRAAVAAEPASLTVKSADGSDKGSAQLALKVAPEETAKGVVHRYLVYAQQNARRGTASTLTRREVRGGGRKPYEQKGTGNARRGSSVSPLFPGGGVTFGPKPKDWSIKMNKKERRLALATALQSAAPDMIVVESLKEQVPDRKTKSLVSLLTKLGTDPMSRKTLLIVKEMHEQVALAGRNIQRLRINTADSISIFDVLNAQQIVVEDAALEFVQSFYGPAAAAEPASA